MSLIYDGLNKQMLMNFISIVYSAFKEKVTLICVCCKTYVYYNPHQLPIILKFGLWYIFKLDVIFILNLDNSVLVFKL